MCNNQSEIENEEEEEEAINQEITNHSRLASFDVTRFSCQFFNYEYFDFTSFYFLDQWIIGWRRKSKWSSQKNCRSLPPSAS